MFSKPVIYAGLRVLKNPLADCQTEGAENRPGLTSKTTMQVNFVSDKEKYLGAFVTVQDREGQFVEIRVAKERKWAGGQRTQLSPPAIILLATGLN